MEHPRHQFAIQRTPTSLPFSAGSFHTSKNNQQNNEDYAECEEFDLTRCVCEGGGGIALCNQCKLTQLTARGKEKCDQGFSVYYDTLINIHNQLKSGKNLNEVDLRRKEAHTGLQQSILQTPERKGPLPPPPRLGQVHGHGYPHSHIHVNNGGTSFSSNSTDSSSSSGYMSSLYSPVRIPDGDLIQFQEKVLKQLKSLWAEEKRKLLEQQAKLQEGNQMKKRDECQTQRPIVTSHPLEVDVVIPRNKQCFKPGIYQTSSCLKNREDIYEYIPPKFDQLSKTAQPQRKETIPFNSSQFTLLKQSSNQNQSQFYGSVNKAKSNGSPKTTFIQMQTVSRKPNLTNQRNKKAYDVSESPKKGKSNTLTKVLSSLKFQNIFNTVN